MQLTVLFNDPYWVGVVEIEQNQRLYATKHIFGSEPSDQEVYEFVSRELLTLQAHMTVGILVESRTERRANPKRILREVRRQVAQQGLSSKAHEAMRLQIEQGKQTRQQSDREQRDALCEHKRELSRARARAKHRGH